MLCFCYVKGKKINKEKFNSDKDTLGSLKTTAVLLTKTFEQLQRPCISSDLGAVWLVASRKKKKNLPYSTYKWIA